MRRPFLFLAALLFATAACSEKTLVPTGPEGGTPEGGAPNGGSPGVGGVGTAADLIVGAGSKTGVNAQSGEGTLKVDRPDDVAAGDFLLAQITFEKGADIDNLVRPSADWYPVIRTNSIHPVTGTDLGQAIFYKFAAASEPADYTWEFRKGSSLEQVRAAGGITRYTGVDPDNPIVASSGDAGDGLVLTAPGVTAEAKSMLVAFFGHKKLTTLSNPVGMAHLYHQQHSNQSGPTIRASEELREAAGPTGPRVSNADPVVGADKWVAQLVALRAAPTVTVNKVVVNDALEDPGDDLGRFDLRVNGVTRKADAGHGDGTGAVPVAVGSVTVSELAGTDTDLDDYVSDVSCDSDKGSSDGTSHTFTIASGEDVVCTITNTRKAVLTVTKELVPDTDEGLFNLEIDGETAGTGGEVGDGGTTGPVKLAPGDHTVSESAVAPTDLDDYEVEIDGDCADDGTITLTSGEVASCTITNTRKATGFTFYLHHNPSPPASSSSFSSTRPANPLPMNGTQNFYSGSAPNYDTNADAQPGRLIQKNSDNVNQTDVTKVITWKSPAFSQAIVITKATSTTAKVVDFFVRHKDNTADKVVAVKFYVSDCPATLAAASGSSSGCTRLASGTWTRPAGLGFTTQSPHVELAWLGTLAASHTIAAGRVLELKVINPDPPSTDDLTVLYDTTDQAARLIFNP